MSFPQLAAIQMVSGNNLDDNLAEAARLVQEAASQGAKLVVLPETFALFSSREQQALGEQEAGTNAKVRPFIRQLARQLGVWIVAGTIPLALDTLSRVRSSCWVVDDQGAEKARYDKIHLFDVDVADQQGSYRESDTFSAGDKLTIVETPWGRLGLAVCYDIRFPEMFRAMFAEGVDIIAIPAAFTLLTGKAHWLPLLRARAIENQCYIIGANQGGVHSPARSTSGESAIIDGWGNILAQRESGAGVVLAKFNRPELDKIRKAMPVASHQRFSVQQNP